MKQTVFNRRVVGNFLLSGLLTALSVVALCFGSEVEEVDLGLLFLWIGLSMGFIAVIRPWQLTFDETGLTIRYFFGCYESIPWDTITYVAYAPSSGWFNIFDVLLPTYRVEYTGGRQGNFSFFTRSEIPANRRIRRLLRTYGGPDILI